MSIDKNYDEMPIVKTVVGYKEKNTIPLHMPGHKKGNSFEETGIALPWQEALKYDTTEVDEIDNLHFPEGAILEAEKKAAALFGAEETYFLVNGTTVGILGMIHAVAQPGDEIIIPRNCHKSVYNAVVLGRLKPVFLHPEVEDQYEVAMGIAPGAVEEAFEKHPEAKAVVITNPTFYGVCSDLERIAEITHRRGGVLLVDEAHGAHFGFTPLCPNSALSCGADAVAQSTHKCLSSFTGSSMLHIQGSRIDRERLRFYLQAYQTSSPNHLMLAGLDAARYQMEKPEGIKQLEQVALWGMEAKERIQQLPGLTVIDDRLVGTAAVWEVDPTRLAVSVKGLGISGTDAEHFLKTEFNIQLEMADLNNIIAILSIGDCKRNVELFIEGLAALSKKYSASAEMVQRHEEMKHIWDLPETAMEPWTAMLGKKKILSISDAVGEVAAELIIPYPPGIPVLMPGERISESTVEYINNCIKYGIKINSSAGNPQGHVSVVSEESC